MSSEPVIQLENVSKSYRYFRLSGAILRLDPGQIMGLVGPNGAGKSTIIRIMMGLIRPDAGEVRIHGYAIPGEQAAAKREIGYVSEEMGLYGSATLAWHMRFVAAVRPGWDHAYAGLLLERFNLHADQKISALSHGERMKAMILLALAYRPRLLLLDEPTTGLDPVARHEILSELMDALRDERRAILFSSHNTPDVEQISDVITFLDRGRIIDSSDKELFLDRWRRIRLEVPADGALPDLPGAVDSRVSGRLAVVTTRDYSPAVHAACEMAGVTIHEVQRMTLEEIFVANVMRSRQEMRA